MAADIPAWLQQLASYRPGGPDHQESILQRTNPTGNSLRQAAVLMLLGGDPSSEQLPQDATILLTQRAATLRHHSGQVAFPGGAVDPHDSGPVEAALREATEETGLDATGVDVLGSWPNIFVPPSGFEVTPVLGYWRTPGSVRVVDAGEAARVSAVSVHELCDPKNRFVVRHPLGYEGPAFHVDSMVVWGFTGGVLSALLAIAGWADPWDETDIRDLGETLAAAGMTLPLVGDTPLLRGDDDQ